MYQTQDEQDEEFTEIYVWGNDYYGQLGVGSEKCVHRLPKVCSFNIVISQISCGEEHSAFVSSGGHLYSMGSNAEGKLGVGGKSLKHSNVPCLVESLNDIIKVSCGMSHTLAITEKGEAYSWGQGFYGALGVSKNGLESYFTPQKIDSLSFEQITDISAGSRHSLFLSKTAKVFACGDAKSGQLGISQMQSVDRLMVPTLIQGLSDTKIKSLCCGKFHSLFLSHTKEVWTCGGNSFGQLGIGSKKNLYEPVKIQGLTNVRSISAWHFSAAVTLMNELYVWGTGIFGEFLTPKLMTFKNLPEPNCIKTITIGGSFSSIVDSNDRIHVWGANTNGEMGLGDTQPRINPTRLQTIEDKQILQVGVGSAFAFALGQRLRNHENYQTYVTEEGTLMTQGYIGTSFANDPQKHTFNTRNLNNCQEYQSTEKDFHISNLKDDVKGLVIQNEQLSKKVKDGQMTQKESDSDRVMHDQYKDKIEKLETEVSLLQNKLQDKDKYVQTLREENAKFKAEVGDTSRVDRLQQELENVKKSENSLKIINQQYEENQKSWKDYHQIKSELEKYRNECDRLRRERDDLQYKFARQHKENTFKALPDNQAHKILQKETTNNNETIDISCSPRQLARIVKQEPSSPMFDDKSNLKIEDLAEKKIYENYNPIWRLQVTDETSTIQYDGKFVDKNIGQRDFKVDHQMPKDDEQRQQFIRDQQQKDHRQDQQQQRQMQHNDDKYKRERQVFSDDRREKQRDKYENHNQNNDRRQFEEIYERDLKRHQELKDKYAVNPMDAKKVAQRQPASIGNEKDIQYLLQVKGKDYQPAQLQHQQQQQLAERVPFREQRNQQPPLPQYNNDVSKQNEYQRHQPNQQQYEPLNPRNEYQYKYHALDKKEYEPISNKQHPHMVRNFTSYDWKNENRENNLGRDERKDMFQIKLQPVDQINRVKQQRQQDNKPAYQNESRKLEFENRNPVAYQEYERIRSPPPIDDRNYYKRELQPVNYHRY